MESEKRIYVHDVYAVRVSGESVRLPLANCELLESGIIVGRDPMSGQVYYVRNWDRCKKGQEP